MWQLAHMAPMDLIAMNGTTIIKVGQPDSCHVIGQQH
jgi:hypothetical protein